MKEIIRKTGEEITIVSYQGGIDRNDSVDNVSYIDSNGVEHLREKMNLFWDVEVFDRQKELVEQQTKNAKMAMECANKAANNSLSKKETIALNVYVSIINGVYAHGHSKYWRPEEIAKETSGFVDCFMETFIKEKQP